MQDITPSLRRAVANAEHWSRDDVERVLSQIAGGAPDRSLDWDEDAGESWARIVDADGVVAMVSVRLPLIVVRDAVVSEIDRSAWNAELVDVASVDEENLHAENAALVEAFPELIAQLDHGAPDFSPEHFAPEQLWFLTV